MVIRQLSHTDSKGRARMVDVGPKTVTNRRAVAYGEIRIRPEALRLIRSGKVPKGDVLAVARVAGILAAKRVDSLIPLCHSLNLDAVEIDFELMRDRIGVRAEAQATGRTGVEMEALSAVAAACLTVYDMAKAADRTMTIGPICLLEKEGGRSGHFIRPEDGNGR